MAIDYTCDVCGAPGHFHPAVNVSYEMHCIPLPDGWVTIRLGNNTDSGDHSDNVAQLCSVNCAQLWVEERMSAPSLAPKGDSEEVPG